MLVKKISTKTMGYDKPTVQKMVLADEKTNHFLYRVFGEARGYVSGTTRFSDKDEPSSWQALAGDFEAMNRDGEVFNAAVCFLPQYVTGPIVESLKQDGGGAVQFAFDIFAQYDKQAATSYIFLAQPLRADGDASPLDKLRGMISTKALPNAPAAPQIEGPKPEGKVKK